MTKPNTACDVCGKPIYRRPSSLKKYSGKFCSISCLNRVHGSHPGPRGPNPKLQGPNNGRWKGGISHHTAGYIYIYNPIHPRTNCRGYVAEQILVIEKSIGRYLKPDESIHHINKIRDDNRLENLQLMKTRDHHALHGRENIIKYNKEKRDRHAQP